MSMGRRLMCMMSHEPWAVWGCVELFTREPATPLLADLPSAVSARRPCERLVAPQ